MMDEEKALINDMFLVSLFQILAESPQMSADRGHRAREREGHPDRARRRPAGR
jgi:hypothetical protein